MVRSPKAAQKRKIVVSVGIACFCVIGLVFSKALQQKTSVRRTIPHADAQGVAEIAKSFSFSFRIDRSPKPKIVNLAAEGLVRPDSNATEPGVMDEGSFTSGSFGVGDAWLTMTNPAASARASRLFFRSSLPTFAQARRTISSRNPWAASAARYLDTSFGALMDSVFKHGDEAASVPDLSRQRQEARNPFTEARLKEDAEAAPAANHAPPASPPAKEAPHAADQNAATSPPPNQQPQAVGGSPQNAHPEGPFLVLGDFSGNGTVEARSATRVDDGTFAFQDGLRSFNLFINPAAAELQRSFAIDDFNQDGVADLVVTSRAALLGAMLFGDGQGDYRVADTFVTGYEPIVPVPGLSANGFRDILTVNVRTGWIRSFRRTDSYQLIHGQAAITFSPDFVSRITEAGSGADCIMAAQSGDSAVIYRWQNDGTLAPSGDDLPQAPSTSINKDFLQQNALGNLQFYQIGASTSVMLTSSGGASFNVANFRTFPNLFVMVGDISKQGTLDVAVAYLLPAR